MAVSQPPKYEQVKQSLIAEIRSGRWVEGSEFPSEAQLLKRYKVSRPTLVRSLREMVREGFLHRHQGLGTFVANHKPQEQSTTILPVFVSTEMARFLGGMCGMLLQIMHGVQDALGPYHSGLVVHQSPGESVDEQTREFVEQTPPGAPGAPGAPGPGAALVVDPSFNPKLFTYLTEQGWTLWAINEPIDYGNCVYIDQERAGYLATKYLLDNGCARIALLNGPVESYWGFAARLRGYRQAMEQANITINPQWIRQGAHVIDSEAGRTMMRSLLEQKVRLDGVVGVSDTKALGAMATVKEHGLRVPQDIRFVSIDNALADQADPPISSIAMPFKQAGWQAAVQALEGAPPTAQSAKAYTAISLKPTLIER